MKFQTKMYFIILMFHYYATISCESSQRLILPTTGSLLKIIPSVEMPMASTSSIASGLSFKVPISVHFPSVTDVFQSFRQTLNNGIQNNNINNNPQRLSIISQDAFNANKSRVESRAHLYNTIEKTHKSLGRVCLMRAICEVAEVPLISPSSGLLGELFDMLLTTSFLSDDTGILSHYGEAEQIGKQAFSVKQNSCKKKYKECPLSLFNILDIPFG